MLFAFNVILAVVKFSGNGFGVMPNCNVAPEATLSVPAPPVIWLPLSYSVPALTDRLPFTVSAPLIAPVELWLLGFQVILPNVPVNPPGLAAIAIPAMFTVELTFHVATGIVPPLIA